MMTGRGRVRNDRSRDQPVVETARCQRDVPVLRAQGMMYRGAFLHQEIVGTDETVALCLDIADMLDPDDGATPVSDTQH